MNKIYFAFITQYIIVITLNVNNHCSVRTPEILGFSFCLWHVFVWGRVNWIKSNQTLKGHNYQNHDILNWVFYIPVGISNSCFLKIHS